MKRKKKRTIYILFADGGWVEFDPCERELVSSGDDWNQVLHVQGVSPDSVYRAVPVRTILDLMMGEG